MANNLIAFLAQRFQASYNNLNCPMLLNIPNPVTTQTDANGVVTSATFNMQAISMPIPTAQGPNCIIDGQLINGCTGTATINGQTCPLSFENNIVSLACPTKP